MAERCKLRTEIEKTVKDWTEIQRNAGMKTDTQFGYGVYFNYDLNTTTWRMLVNKQISMNYHRLLIEMRVNEVKKRERKLKMQIEEVDNQIYKVQ